MRLLTYAALAISFARTYASEKSNRKFKAHLQYTCQYIEDPIHTVSDLPCVVAEQIRRKCVYPPNSDEPTLSEENPLAFQRVCLCQSQWFDQFAGCQACFEAHGGQEGFDYVGAELQEELRQAYCDFGSIPRTGLMQGLQEALALSASSARGTAAPSRTATVFSDPIGNKTEVTRYYTPSVMGPDAIDTAVPTAAVGMGNPKYTTTNISGGLVVPTMVASGESEGDATTAASSNDDSEETGSGGATASQDGGAAPTAVSFAGMEALFGAVGLAAVVAGL